jgi:FtsX-like permease family protein
MPLDRALSRFAAAGDEPAIPNELWLALTPATSAQPVTLPSVTGVTFVVYRAYEQAAALNDPILIQLRGNLAIGFASALGLAVLGFSVHFLIASRRRLAEHAILLAGGLEPGDIRRGIALEQIAVVVFGLVAGALLAVVAVIVLLPSLQLGNKPENVIPPTVIHLDGIQLALGALVLVLAMTLVAWMARGAGSAVNVVEELRRLG